MKHLQINEEGYKTLLENYGSMIVATGYSRQVIHFTSFIREFFFFLETNEVFRITEVKVHHIIAYYEYLKERPNHRQGGGLSGSVIQTQLFALRLLFDHLVNTGVLDSSPATLPKFQFGGKGERSACTLEEIEQLYAACETKKDRALLALAYGCGLRRTEIVRLDVTDINFLKGTLTVRKGKNGKTRTICVSDHALTDLREYYATERRKVIEQFPIDPSDSFLLNRFAQRANGILLNRRVQELAEKTGNAKLIQKEISLHYLRHSIATHLIDNGADIDFVKEYLGHTLIDTTLIYCKRRKQRPDILKQALVA